MKNLKKKQALKISMLNLKKIVSSILSTQTIRLLVRILMLMMKRQELMKYKLVRETYSIQIENIFNGLELGDI